MLSGLLRPVPGYRTYSLMQHSLLAAAGIAAFGIWKGVDLLSLAALVAAIIAPITGAAAKNNYEVARADATGARNVPP